MSDKELLNLLEENDKMIAGSEVASGATTSKIKEFQEKLASIDNRLSLLF